MTGLRYDGRVAVVTGAGRGLGREYALLLGRRGAKVVVNDLGGSTAGVDPNIGPANDVAREINQLGGEAVADIHSVATKDGATSVVDSALEHFGRVDILINNAGNVWLAPFEGYPDEMRDLQIDTHLKGAWNVTQRAWSHMRQQGYGRVLMIISAAGVFGGTENSAYCAAKGGLIGLTRALALEGAQSGITVNGLSPAGMTRMWRTRTDPSANPELEDPDWTKRYLDPSLVAPGACWLVHEECTATGRLFTCSSGRMASVFNGEARGFVTEPENFSLEAVRDNWATVTTYEPYVVPRNTGEHVEHIKRLVEERARIGNKKA